MSKKLKAAIIIAIPIVILALLISVFAGKAQKKEAQPAPTEAPATATPFVPSTAAPESYSDVKVPEGVYVIDAPPEATAAVQPAANPAEGMNIPSGITVVDAPAEANTSANANQNTASSNAGSTGAGSNSGIYIVDAPKENSSAASGSTGTGNNSGIYIVDPPKENSSSASTGSGNSGITIVDPPKENGKNSSNSSSSSQSSSYVPVGSVIGSGSVYSSSGTGMNLVADYTATVASDSSVNVKVSVNLLHSSLYTKSNSLTISFGGNSVTLSAPSISYDGGSKTTNLGSHTFTVPLSRGNKNTFTLSASWQFQGTYGGKSIPSLSCSQSVTLSR